LTVVTPEQLTLDDLIDRAIESARLQADLVDRRALPEAAVSGPERLVVAMVKRGLPEHALHSAARLVIELERQANHAQQ